jgi:hypothetical protein
MPNPCNNHAKDMQNQYKNNEHVFTCASFLDPFSLRRRLALEGSASRSTFGLASVRRYDTTPYQKNT